MTGLVIVICSLSIGIVVDKWLRRFLIARTATNIRAALLLRGMTEVEVTIWPLPNLLHCWHIWRASRRDRRREQQISELSRLRRKAIAHAVGSGALSINEARDMNREAA